ncbi:MAG: hypothetical protein UU76_C0017G0006 [Parcubacteria group bacterium GW2011_GWC1_41_7]|nr:MAG: hypothetical protein UU76_C0017G0006 [Parcubacteria group bacterium GW2011_GWC1_41_7]
MNEPPVCTSGLLKVTDRIEMTEKKPGMTGIIERITHEPGTNASMYHVRLDDGTHDIVGRSFLRPAPASVT